MHFQIYDYFEHYVRWFPMNHSYAQEIARYSLHTIYIVKQEGSTSLDLR